MTCQEALSLLYDVIDKEASEIDAQEVKEHLNQCRHCSEIYKVEESVNALVREKLAHQRTTPRMRHLKEKILSDLDAVDSESACACSASARPTTEVEPPAPSPETPAPAAPSFKLGRYLAVAASLIVVVGTVYIVQAFMSHDVQFGGLEDAHFEAVQQVAQFASAGVTAAPASFINERLSYDLSPAVQEFSLVGGQLETVNGIEMAHFVYTSDETVVSVFVARATEFTIPEELLAHPVVRGQIQLFDHHCKGCRLVYHQVGDAIIITATENREVELLEFIPGQGTV